MVCSTGHSPPPVGLKTATGKHMAVPRFENRSPAPVQRPASLKEPRKGESSGDAGTLVGVQSWGTRRVEEFFVENQLDVAASIAAQAHITGARLLELQDASWRTLFGLSDAEISKCRALLSP